MFVSFSGLHESEQFRCSVDVVLCTGNGSECFAVGCFYIPVAKYSLARLRIQTFYGLCLFSNLLYVFLMVPPRLLLYNQYYITNSISAFGVLSGIV